MALLDGLVAIVTGAGGGIGRAEALALAAHGAAVVVNDLGGPVDGSPGAHHKAADAVAATIVERGGTAVVNRADISDWTACRDLVDQAVTELGGLDIVVSNAGVVRRGRIDEVSEADVDLLSGVLLKGTIAVLHHAFHWWRGEHEHGRGRPRSAIVTSSSAGVPGGVQEFGVYGAMKAGAAALTLSAALEMRELGVTVNAICPHAATRMDAFAKDLAFDGTGDLDDSSATSPVHVADLVSWLVSPEARHLTGQVFEVGGGLVRLWRPWSPGPEVQQEARWTPADLGVALATDVYGTMPGGRTISRGAGT
jgi:NAD(P)-dependent dehydrogenase (short-subunit alcohol dehydrogenase family)